MFNNIYQGKNVLVTGHTGFKGSWLSVWLQMLGANVAGIALAPITEISHYELLKLDMTSHIIDIRNYDELYAAIKKSAPDIVFHLAAQPLVRESYVTPLETFNTNVMGTANVLNACRDAANPKAIVVITSDKCYDNKEWLWGYRETDPLGGYDPYSASKGCAELIASCYRNSFFNLEEFGKSHQTLLATARAGNVIGGGDWAKDRLITDIMLAIAKGETVHIRSPYSIRPWQHVLDCLHGYLCLGEKLLAGNKEFAQAWNFAPTTGQGATVLEIVGKIKEIWPRLHFEICSANQPYHEANLLKLDSSKANSLLKWRNKWDIATTVVATTNWYRNFYENAAVTTVQDIENYIHSNTDS